MHAAVICIGAFLVQCIGFGISRAILEHYNGREPTDEDLALFNAVSFMFWPLVLVICAFYECWGAVYRLTRAFLKAPGHYILKPFRWLKQNLTGIEKTGPKNAGPFRSLEQ